MAKYLELDNSTGKPKNKSGLSVTTGVSDANKIVETGADGLLDPSLMPSGIGADLVTAPAFENLSAGNIVNIFSDSGTLKIRKADASQGASYRAMGFVKSAVTAGASASAYLNGIITGLTGLSIGTDYFLSQSTAGGVQTTVASTTNHIVQSVGRAKSSTELIFKIGETFIV